MPKLTRRSVLFAAGANLLRAQQTEPGFTQLFDGRTLDGWQLIGGRGPGYIVENGAIVCPADGGGNLFTVREFADFTLRLEWRFWDGGNNGVGIRSPLSRTVSTDGMEIQVLDDESGTYRGRLRPEQYTGSVYGVAAARMGFVKRNGVWNNHQITAYGPRIHVVLNGEDILDTDLSRIADEDVYRKHPGIRRAKGHIGLLGHGTRVEFRNLRIKEL